MKNTDFSELGCWESVFKTRNFMNFSVFYDFQGFTKQKRLQPDVPITKGAWRTDDCHWDPCCECMDDVSSGSAGGGGTRVMGMGRRCGPWGTTMTTVRVHSGVIQWVLQWALQWVTGGPTVSDWWPDSGWLVARQWETPKKHRKWPNFRKFTKKSSKSSKIPKIHEKSSKSSKIHEIMESLSSKKCTLSIKMWL